MEISFKVNHPITTDQFIGLLDSSTLGERRPIHDRDCMEGMVSNSNLIVSAWDDSLLVGLARSVTDFHYACYLSDLAVHRNYQRSGIGKRLQSLTQEHLGPLCKLILIAAPAANSYYGQIGYTHNERCWVLDPGVTPSGGFTPIVQGCGTDAFLAGQLGNSQTVRWSHLLENGFFTFR